MTYREAYETWLKEFADDRATVDELKAIAGDEKEIEDRFYTELSFGTAGMRGVLGAGTNRMNLYNVRRATKGFADYINSQNPEYRQRGVVIAYDSRRMSPEFAKASALVLCHEGIHVYLFDELRPVPILSYAVRHLHAIAGIVITASHNPPQYNGYKVYWEDGAQMPPEYADQVLARIRANRYEDAVEMDEAEAKAKGLLQIIGSKEVDDDYIAQVKTLSVQPELMKTAGKALKIVYTPLHGSGNKPVRRILKEIGIEVTLNVTDFSNWLDAIVNGKQQMYLGGWTVPSADATEAFAAFNSAYIGKGDNRSFYANDDVDALIEIINTETDSEKRMQACEDLQKLLADECVTVGLYVGLACYSVNKDISNFVVLPSQSPNFAGITFAN